MTRMEYIQSCTKEQLVKFLCDIVNETNNRNEYASICEHCPAEGSCSVGHTGFIDWLEQEKE